MLHSAPVRRVRRALGFIRRHAPTYWAETAQRAPEMPRAHRLRYLMQGFHPLEGSWYDQVHGSTRGFISNFHRETSLHGLNVGHEYLLGNKVAFAQAMCAHDVPHPQVFGHTHRSRWHWIKGGERQLQEALQRDGKAVIKPIDGKKGRAVEIITSIDALDRQRSDDVLVTAFVQQADYAASIFPGSLNTIRVLTLIPRDGNPCVAAAVHRFGTSETGAVDNFSAGGLVAWVDLPSGRMDTVYSIGTGNDLVRSDHHPETGVQVKATEVPHWTSVKVLVLNLCNYFPFLRYVGWDIAVTTHGPVVIEGNAFPSLSVFQFYRPLLKDADCQDFFAEFL